MGMEEHTEEQKAEQKEEKTVRKRSLHHVTHILVQADKLMRRYGMQICIENGMHIDTDENGIRVQLSLIQIPKQES
jgi:hypothetical protein